MLMPCVHIGQLQERETSQRHVFNYIIIFVELYSFIAGH